MAADTLKSATITNLDGANNAPPSAVVYASGGDGAPGRRVEVSDFCTPTTGGLASTSSIYKMVRVPSKAFISYIEFMSTAKLDSNASPTLTWDIGAYYSDSISDGTPVANQGTQISANCFGAAIATPAAMTWTQGVNNLTSANYNVPAWKAAGLSSDPGGFIDIVFAVHAVAATAVSADLRARVAYNQ